MKRVLLLYPVLALMLAAQDPNQEKPRTQAEPKLFILKYADPYEVQKLLASVFNTAMMPDTQLHALAVSATNATLPAIEEAIQRLDTPASQPKDIELTAYYLAGSTADTTDGEPVSKDLDSVVAQLKTAFSYSHYRLMDTLTLRTRAGQPANASSVGGRVTMGNISQPITNNFRIQSASLSADGTTVRIDKLAVNERLPVATGSTSGGNPNFSYHDIGYNADGLDIKEGQKAVVGRLGASQGQALFLVLQAHVIQ